MKTLLLLTLLFACSSAEKGVRCFQNTVAPGCSCVNVDTDVNDVKCDATQFKHGYCCSTRGWPDDLGTGNCTCEEARCFQINAKNCECGRFATPPGGSMEVASCSASTGIKCCMSNKYGNHCNCNDYTSCDDGVLVSSCTPETLASHCPADTPVEVDSCDVAGEDPFGR